jgi:hypothetical protein
MADLIRDYGAIIEAGCLMVFFIMFALVIQWLTLLFLGKYDPIG